MFDIGFSELVMVAVVALLVIGPKDLPRVARIAGLWVGRARRSLAVVKDEIDREFKAQELKEMLQRQALSNPVEHIIEETRPPLRPAPDPAPEHPASGADLSPSRPAADARKG
ncbi:Sec-independent protein translocase protein TatB [uncultured Thiodictyon sp.]|uniref:Sec-independent protein translocase protein TatB n=1 Tax=uncultured Thiodictyon sp. TaxID=1846217 RepID=UPI0025F22E29|nr:Sec-independent protein translocase protein TatB [uncultured Thiodictyon sp.]